jgi:hypothetical protein
MTTKMIDPITVQNGYWYKSPANLYGLLKIHWVGNEF